MEFISETLGDLIPFFDYTNFIPTEHTSQATFRSFNEDLPSITQEKLLDGYNIRAIPDPACESTDRGLHNFNHLQLLMHPRD